MGGGGVPCPRSGWWGGGGYPIPVVGGTPRPGLDRVPPGQVWMDGEGGAVPHPCGGGGTPPPPIRQSSIASTCYTAGGMPLAFTQEDFLVHFII